jgi:pimeloyl-ACP methyl ester carboxylesterase
LVVYIEGDGFAYLNATQPAQDPTPVDPVALRLALAHPGAGPVAWLARPCQYTADRPTCVPAYWTDARWAPEVVDSAGMALDQLKRDTGAARLVLVGYSGGGALAALLAERRDDVAALVTVAANLDLDSWVRAHDLAPLSRSLNPAAGAAALAALPQIHVRGGRDTVVGPAILRAFMDRLPATAPARVLEIPDQDHAGGWADIWPNLSRRAEFQSLPGWLAGAAGG